MQLNFRITPTRLLMVLLLRVWGCICSVSTRPDTSYCIINGKKPHLLQPERHVRGKLRSVCSQHEITLNSNTASVAVVLVLNLCAVHRA